MAREDWQDREDERRRLALRGRGRDDFGQADYSDDYLYDPASRSGYRAERDVRPSVDDFGQADYSSDYAYDIDDGHAYRRNSEADRDYGRRMDNGDYRRVEQPRSFMDRVGDAFGGHPRERPAERAVEARPPARRRGPSDRVLWAVIVERLHDERGLDLRDLEVIVEDREVTLNGTVRHKGDKRRIEDVADIEGVRHVQNNLRVRGHQHTHWTFL
ncbi:BON domain-containing protein [Phenylobacterium sp.]|uniref:BON domain-containing protein n=1 Tax=Phenylobacterium sp. TaxID=1871053 RepID=UPI0025E7DE7E|nr:BON domain-containing protein [Phenylobacterium sp.]